MKFLFVALMLTLGACQKVDNPIKPVDKPMITIQELSTRSGVNFFANAKVLAQEDSLGVVQQAQSWVVEVFSEPILPAAAPFVTQANASEKLKVMKARAPSVNFGEVVKNEVPVHMWDSPGSSWSYTRISTNKGEFVSLGWVKQ
jgi:hypothetical protein